MATQPDSALVLMDDINAGSLSKRSLIRLQRDRAMLLYASGRYSEAMAAANDAGLWCGVEGDQVNAAYVDSLVGDIYAAVYASDSIDGIHRLHREVHHAGAMKGYGRYERGREWGHLFIFIIITVCGIVLSAGTVVYAIRMHQRKVTMRGYVRQIRAVTAEVEHCHDREARTGVLVRRLLEQRFRELNMLCREYAEKKEAPDKVRLSIYSAIEAELDKLRSDAFMENVERMVDECHDGVVGKFRREMPYVSTTDIRLMTLVAAGMSARTIGLILEMTPGNVYNRKSRMCRHIIAANPPCKEMYLNTLGK